MALAERRPAIFRPRNPGDDKARLAAWHRVVTGAENPATVHCDSPITRNGTLGASLGLIGTPTLVAADGRVLPGAAPADRIDAWLSQKKPATTSAAAN